MTPSDDILALIKYQGLLLIEDYAIKKKIDGF